MKSVRLTRVRLAAFVSPQIPLSALSILLFVNLPPFYATEMGLGLVAVSQAFFFGRIWDVFLDPLFGALSDRLRLRWGRRRPWIVGYLPILVVSDPAAVPAAAWGDAAAAALHACWIFYVGWTCATLSFLCLGLGAPPTTTTAAPGIQGWYQFAVTGGVTLVLGLLAFIERSGGSRAQQLAAMGVFTAALLPITFLTAVSVMGERQVKAHEPLTLRLALGAFRTDEPLRFVLAAALLSRTSRPA